MRVGSLSRERLALAAQGAPTECWPWPGSLDRDGYGRYGTRAQAHRTSYLLLVGPIPKGLVVDHLCRNRACVNPAHMEIVPKRENTMRGMSPAAVNARKSRCINGHEFNEANTYVARSGTRSCRPCNAAAVKRYAMKTRVSA